MQGLDDNAFVHHAKISELKGWDKNPKDIHEQDLQRLKRQIQELGVYKPLVVAQEADGSYTVLGGNQRLKALKELGAETAWVCVVKAEDEATKLKYALSDNDQAGYYKERELANLVKLNENCIVLEDFKVSLANFGIKEFINPKELMFSEYPEKDIGLLKTENKCPKCGYEW